MKEVVYVVTPIPVPPDPVDSFAGNGLVDLAGLDNGGVLLAMERSFAVGVGNTVKIFELLTDNAATSPTMTMDCRLAMIQLIRG